MFPEFLRRQPIQPFRLQVKRQVFDAKLQIVWYKRFSNLFYTDVSYSVGMLVTVSKDLLYGFLVIFDFVQVLTISINEFVVFFRGSNWRAIIHNSKGWSNEKCWKNSNVSFWLTRLVFYQRQKTKNLFLRISKQPDTDLFPVGFWPLRTQNSSLGVILDGQQNHQKL